MGGKMRKSWKAMAVLSFAMLAMNCRGAESKPLIQLAILLDTSNSMDGLINQARGHLWKVVNEFAAVRKGEERPEIRVALLEYGNNSLQAKEGYVRLVMPFTTDLDRVSEELFALTTNGGDEYCGLVIRDAREKLQWSKSAGDYKAIFIAGNEPFTQGGEDYRESCKKAIKNGIIVNTIHCGDYAAGVSGGWKDGADIADGSYVSIDQDKAVAYMEAPQDREIETLGKELNKTYIAYGNAGRQGKERQEAQEKNAAVVSMESAITRQVAKSSVHYNNAEWDLVDAVVKDGSKLKGLKKDELPAEMKNMSEKEREEYVKTMGQKRLEIQNRINTLNMARQKYLAAKTAGSACSDTLDAAIIKAIRTQAGKKQFSFDGSSSK